MEIQVQASVGVCTEFMSKVDGEKGELSVVIAPLKLLQNPGTEKIQILWGCNLFESCFNPDCWYSIEARRKKKA